MTAELYNCKQIDDNHYRIMKFDNSLEPFKDSKGRMSIYTVSSDGCDCPQGHKTSCRHRKMLPFFLEHNHVNDGWFFIWATHQWLKATGIFVEAAQEAQKDQLEGTDEWINHEGSHKDASAAPSPQPSPYRRMR